MKQLPQLADVATDQQTGGLAVSLVIDRVTASRLGIAPSTIDSTLYDAYGQRQISTMYTQLNQYHVILETDPSASKPRQAAGSVHPDQCFVGRIGPGSIVLVLASSGSSSAGSNATTTSVAYTPSSGVLSCAGQCAHLGRRRQQHSGLQPPIQPPAPAPQCRAAQRVHAY
jgi:multidrug efflux pump